MEHHKWYSHNLGREMEIMRYGHSGQPILVFPSSKGRYFDYASNGMVDAVSEQIRGEKVQLFAIDGIDGEAWENESVHPVHRGPAHEAYDRYVTQEVIPFIRNIDARRPITTGCSMGGYHAGNFFFRHPDLFGGVISLSGVFNLKLFVGDYVDELVYFNSPLHYLPHLEDPWYLEQYRQSQIFVCVGQGAWEDEMRVDADQLRTILDEKGVPAWIDFWGHDVNHDWPWWRVQMPYFVDKLAV